MLKPDSRYAICVRGDPAVMVHIYFDASHASDPRSRSITGILTKLNETAGTIYVKTSAQATQKLWCFESEVGGNTTAFKVEILRSCLQGLCLETPPRGWAFRS
jgi:hypothetical protein